MSQPLCLENLPRTVELERDGDGRPRLAYIDQRRLPGELAFERTGDWRVVVGAVKSLAVHRRRGCRGAVDGQRRRRARRVARMRRGGAVLPGGAGPRG